MLSASELAAIETWWDGFMAAFEARTCTPVFTHSDINEENLLVALDGTRLVGVVDFEHCAVGDPFDDFDSLQYLGRDFYGEAVEAYERLGGPSLAGAEPYLDSRWQRGAFPGIRRAWQRGDAIEADAVRARLHRHNVLPSSS